MRVTLAALIWVAIVGGVWGYMAGREKAVSSQKPLRHVREIRESFTMEVTPTFDTEADPFALRGEADSGILINKGEERIFSSDKAKAAVPVSIKLDSLKEGVNEFFIQATPPEGEEKAHGVRLRLFRGLAVVADETFWADGGAQVIGVFRVSLEGEQHNGH